MTKSDIETKMNKGSLDHLVDLLIDMIIDSFIYKSRFSKQKVTTTNVDRN